MINRVHSLLPVYFVGVSINTKEVFWRCEVRDIGLNKPINDLARILLLLDLLIEVIEEIGLIGHSLIQIILKPLHY